MTTEKLEQSINQTPNERSFASSKLVYPLAYTVECYGTVTEAVIVSLSHSAERTRFRSMCSSLLSRMSGYLPATDSLLN